MTAPTSERRKARVLLALVLALGLANGSHAVAQTGRADYERQRKSDSYKRAQRFVKDADKRDTALCERARQDAFDLMLEHAAQMGANAVVAMRYDANDVAAGVTEVLCYGTAVVIEPVARGDRTDRHPDQR